MFIVTWEAEPPGDKLQWIGVLREVFASAAGSYRIRFWKTENGWRFDLDPRLDLGLTDPEQITNTDEAVRFNLQYLLREKGLPMDPEGDSSG